MAVIPHGAVTARMKARKRDAQEVCARLSRDLPGPWGIESGRPAALNMRRATVLLSTRDALPYTLLPETPPSGHSYHV